MSDNPLGSATQLAWGYETARGVPDFTNPYGLLFTSHSIAGIRSQSPTTNMHPSNHRLAGMHTKTDLGGSIVVQPTPDAIARLNAHFRGWTEITTLVSGAYSWECREFLTGDTPVANPVDFIYALIELNDGYEHTFSGGRVSRRVMNIVANSLVGLTYDVLFQSETTLDQPTEIAVDAAYTGQIQFRGMPRDETAGAYLLKCTVSGALDGTAKLEGAYMGKGTVATAGDTTLTGTGTAFTDEYVVGDTILVDGETSRVIATIPSDTSLTVTVAFSTTDTALTHQIAYGGASRRMSAVAGVWTDLLLPHGDYAGANYPAERVQFMLTAGGTLTADDEWSVAVVRGQTTVTPSARRPLTAVGCKVLIDSEEVEVESAVIESVVPREAYFTPGYAHPKRIINSGQRGDMVTFQRRYLDRELYRALLAQNTIAFTAQLRGDRIGTTAYYEGWDVVIPYAKIDAAGARGVAGPDELPESVSFYAFYDPAQTDVPYDTIITTVPTIIPA